MFLLKLFLYLIIVIICLIGAYKVSNTYKYISSLNVEKISKWLNKNNDHNYLIDVKNITINLDGLNICFILEDILISDINIAKKHTNINSALNIIQIQQITGKINILSSILFGKIKINNIIVKEINVTANSIYSLQKIKEIIGNITIDVNFYKNIDKILNITSEFLADNISFKINTILTLNIKNNNIKLIKFKLENTAKSVRDVIKYLPENLINKKILYWIDAALISGSIKSSKLLLDENHNFTMELKFQEIKLQYANNWPAIEKFSATMVIADNNLTIHMDPGSHKGFILHQPIKSLSAKLTGIDLDIIPPLLVKAEIMSLTSKGLEFIKKSNLNKLGIDLDKIVAHGKINLSIELLVPTDNFVNTSESIKFSGNCELIKSDINLSNFNVNLADLVGNIKFTNNYLAADDLQVKIFDVMINTKFVLENNYLSIATTLFNAKIFFDKQHNHHMLQGKNLNMIVEELCIFNNVFKKIKFFNHAANDTLFFESDDAKGSLVYKELNSGKYHISFDKLKISTNDMSSNHNNSNFIMSAINQIKFNCEKFYLNQLYLGKVMSSFNNNMNNKSVSIDDFNLKNNNITVEAKGNWDIKDVKQSATNMNGQLISKDFGEAIKQLNVNSKFIKNGDGFITFNLTWLNDPFKFNLSNIIGKLHLNINSGVIVGVEPGLGRIIGLLSIANIQRRLNLDFSDVTSGGFSFDTMNGELDINQGQVLFNNIIIKGPSANLTINGNTSLVAQKLDLFIEVTSKVGATLPLAAAIAAGNPVVGAALWLFDHASGAKVSEFKSQKYKVLGTWEKPEINAI